MRRTRKAPHLAEEFGRRVREKREALVGPDGRTMSQERFADMLGLHRTYIGLVERGKTEPVLGSIVLIAAGLGVDPADLVRDMKP